jgi:hypothetical protein
VLGRSKPQPTSGWAARARDPLLLAVATSHIRTETLPPAAAPPARMGVRVSILIPVLNSFMLFAAAPHSLDGVRMNAHENARVARLQRALERRRNEGGAPGADGRLGVTTAAAGRIFEAHDGLTVDRVVRAMTCWPVSRDSASAASRGAERSTTVPKRSARTPLVETRRAGVALAAPAAVMLLVTTAVAQNLVRRRRWDSAPSRARRIARGALVAGVRIVRLAVPGVIATVRARLRRAPSIPIARSDARGRVRPPNVSATLDRAARGRAVPVNASSAAGGWAHERPRIKALARELYVEAEFRDRSVGTVKGFAIAFARREHRRGAETYLLVNDPSKPAAVWVKESEIRLRFPAGRPQRSGYEP